MRTVQLRAQTLCDLTTASPATNMRTSNGLGLEFLPEAVGD